MSFAKLNSAFDIPLGELEERLGVNFNGDFMGYDRIVPPRAIVVLKNISFFKQDILETLIRNIPLRSDSEEKIYPYCDSKIRVFGREPKGLDVGQTFVSESKLLGIMQNLTGGLFSSFVVKGISKMPPVQLYGLDAEGKPAIAFYLPPIVEIHGEHAALIDGMHRSYLCSSAGTTINAIHISNVKSPLPFDILSWKDVKIGKVKPPINERYKNLRRELFRDLGAVGIDG